MARKLTTINKKNLGKAVKKFGGTEELGKVKLDGNEHDAATVEVESKTNLEMDEGYGNVVTIRCFTFGMNPAMLRRFKQEKGAITKQDIFNAHIQGIEVNLWADGWKPYTEVEPRISLDVAKKQYSIYVAAQRMKGNPLSSALKPLTLSEIAHGE